MDSNYLSDNIVIYFPNLFLTWKMLVIDFSWGYSG